MRDYQAAIAQPGNVGIRKPQELLHTLSVHRIVHLGLITPILRAFPIPQWRSGFSTQLS
jgi:hypothetical protein